MAARGRTPTWLPSALVAAATTTAVAAAIASLAVLSCSNTCSHSRHVAFVAGVPASAASRERLRGLGRGPRSSIPRSSEEDSSEGKVRYLPSLDFSLAEDLVPAEGTSTLPCFPLGGHAYVPNTEQVLNIFEPRYRQMYSDILLSGGRRFVVPQISEDELGGVRLSEVGVVFYLDDLKEVSEQTDDRVKYICSHTVISRVRIKKVLNPPAFVDRSTYLRVEVEEMVDTDADEDASELEEKTTEMLVGLASLQMKAQESVRFKKEALETQNVTRGAGFWQTTSVWQNYMTSRAQQRQKQFEEDVKTKIVAYFKEEKGEIPATINLSELPESLQREIIDLQESFQEEVSALVRAQSGPVQELVQTDSHKARLQLFYNLLDEEKRRMEARIALNSLFNNDESA